MIKRVFICIGVLLVMLFLMMLVKGALIKNSFHFKELTYIIEGKTYSLENEDAPISLVNYSIGRDFDNNGQVDAAVILDQKAGPHHLYYTAAVLKKADELQPTNTILIGKNIELVGFSYSMIPNNFYVKYKDDIPRISTFAIEDSKITNPTKGWPLKGW